MRLVPDEMWAVMCLYGEARGELYPGKVAVARVIRNRVAKGWWGHDVPSVVLAPLQFSMFNPSDANRVLAALRNEFGGHAPVKKGEEVKRSSSGAGQVRPASADKDSKPRK